MKNNPIFGQKELKAFLKASSKIFDETERLRLRRAGYALSSPRQTYRLNQSLRKIKKVTPAD
jgi:hypothetical protein